MCFAVFEVLTKNPLHHVPIHLGEAHVATGVAEGELGVLEAEEVEDGGVPVVDVDGINDAFVAELVGLASEVHDLWRRILHAEGEFVRFDEAFDGGVLGLALERGLVELLHEFELAALLGSRELRMRQSLSACVAILENSSLIHKPLCPRCLNSHTGAMSLPVGTLPLPMALPAQFATSGF